MREQIGLELIQLGLLRQVTFPEEPDDLLEGGVFGQGVDVVAAVAENARVAIDITNLGLAGDNAFKSRASGVVTVVVSCVLIQSIPALYFSSGFRSRPMRAMSHDRETGSCEGRSDRARS